MSKSPGRGNSPALGAYRPHVDARRPGGPPAVTPAFRVLVHSKYLAAGDPHGVVKIMSIDLGSH